MATHGKSQPRTDRRLSFIIPFPLHPPLLPPFTHIQLLSSQTSTALLLLDLWSIQLSHYAINTNSVIWAIKPCVCKCMLRVELITITQYGFLPFFPETASTAVNQSAFKRRRPRAERMAESPWKPHRHPKSSRVNGNFHYSVCNGMNGEGGSRGGRFLQIAE